MKAGDTRYPQFIVDSIFNDGLGWKFRTAGALNYRRTVQLYKQPAFVTQKDWYDIWFNWCGH